LYVHNDLGAESCDVYNISLSVHLSAGSLLYLVNTSSSSKQVKEAQCKLQRKTTFTTYIFGAQCYIYTPLVTVKVLILSVPFLTTCRTKYSVPLISPWL